MILVRHGQTLRVIKMDSNQSSSSSSGGGETITDIQNYLETFNKEIEGGEGTSNQIGIKFEAGKNFVLFNCS